MLTEQDIDLVKLNMYKVDNGEISITNTGSLVWKN